MARSGLTQMLRRIHAAHAQAQFTGVPVDEVFEGQAATRLSRADFLAGAAGVGALAAVGAVTGCAKTPAPPQPLTTKSRQTRRIVVVGAGLAGMTCAYRLTHAGLPCEVYEAARAVGGRTWSLRRFFAGGQIAEHGGEFISSEHRALRSLVRELDLELVDLRAGNPAANETYFVRGQRYAERDVIRDYAPVYRALQRDVAAAGFPTTYDRHTRAGVALDRMSVVDWIKANVPGGLESKMGWLLDVDCTTENAGEAAQQSALNLIYMLGYMPTYEAGGGFYIVGTDERYNVAGGNDQIVERMSRHLPGGTVHTDTALVGLRRRSDGSYTCTFQSGARAFDVPADHVVLSLPFTLLREVDFSGAGFSALKATAIKELPLGTTSKLHLQFRNRYWHGLGSNGASYADTGYQQTWDVTRGQAGAPGILVDYTGGDVGASFQSTVHGPAGAQAARRFLAQIEPVYPGIKATWNGKAYLDNWAGDRWHHGSYSYWKVGQCTKFVGIEKVRQGNVHFCGEHTSVIFGGFMNGAVVTGEEAAQEILRVERRAAA
ncbi:MAG: FAD-dependent oxidoreductase [Candidatus Eremiobacteraeota bacterium]|nr:FAD-dependent oxidoreductase [Candidatus Eremiobacteraeota bacterium]MBC5827060.1 FAD-dependent oxidoreductase [Candidatus Eremiobacteraeota bacterium]